MTERPQQQEGPQGAHEPGAVREPQPAQGEQPEPARPQELPAPETQSPSAELPPPESAAQAPGALPARPANGRVEASSGASRPERVNGATGGAASGGAGSRNRSRRDRSRRSRHNSRSRIDDLRWLPSVDAVLSENALAPYIERISRPLVVDVVREVLEETRRRMRDGEAFPGRGLLLARLQDRLARLDRTLFQPVINATGVVLHTNLGRAPLGEGALAAIARAARGYTNLEYDLERGERGSRYVHGERLLCRLTGAEAAMVVNNNAAAVLLVLSTVARGGEVILSRGEMIEIGGAFRIPEVMAQSGCVLREVGTTNRTRLSDYEEAINEKTVAILKVHTSNYRVVGFTESVGTAELAELAHRHRLLLIEDLGSGVLVDTGRFGLAHEPTVQEAVQAGADLVTFSGDKLLGGPQAGVIVGQAGLVARCRKHPLARAVRVGKLTLAALQQVLVDYLDGRPEERIPIWTMIAQTPEALETRARAVAAAVVEALPSLFAAAPAPPAAAAPAGAGYSARSRRRGRGGRRAAQARRGEPDRGGPPAAEGTGWRLEVVEALSTVGGGSLPGETLPTRALRLTPPEKGGAALERLAAALRRGWPPVIGRLEDGALWLDLRTVNPADDQAVVRRLVEAFGQALAYESGDRGAGPQGETP